MARINNDEFLEVSKLAQNLDRNNKIYVIPVGGCGEFGMNMTLYVTSKEVLLVDAGVLFPEARRIGLSGMMPNLSELIDALGGLSAFVLTHGHMDHIGAMPYLLDKWDAPVILGPWTHELVERRVSQMRLSEKYNPKIIHPGQSMVFKGIELTFFPVNHSIPDSCSLIIEAEGQRIYHSGDFKFDDTPVGESPIDFDALEEIGKQGIDLLISDSTGSQHSGFCPSESITKEPLREIIQQANGRVFITTFASNLWRLMTILELAEEEGRKVYIDGRGIDTTLEIAQKLGRIKIPRGLIVAPEELSSLEDDELLVISTGSQGERRAAMHRISYGEHRYFEPEEGDVFVFSSRMIPGNERTIQHLMARIEKYGAKVITQKSNPGIHVSGHAYGGELEKLISLLKPRCYMPVHGTHSQLIQNCSLADGVDTQVFEVEDGQILELNSEGLEEIYRVKVPLVYVDGDSYQLIEPDTYNRRYKVGELGAAIISGVIDSDTAEFISGPEIELVGLETPKKNSRWVHQVKRELFKKMNRELEEFDEDEIREFCRIHVRRKLAETFNKKPVVLSKIFIV